MDSWAIGIDLGGTNVRAAGIDHRGTVLELVAEPVERPLDDRAEPFAQLVRLVAALVDSIGEPPVGIGVGATGPAYPAEGVIDNPFTLPANLQGNVVGVLEHRFGVPVGLENDANAAALGEYWRGAGRGADSLACLFVGTGVGVAVLRDGVLHRGAHGTHPEAGHHVVDPSGPPCYCGASGCVESLASGTALVDLARSHGATIDSAIDVFRQARDGNETCRSVVAAAQNALATAARNLVAAHAADVVVLGGGALGDPAALLDHVQEALDVFEFTPRGGTRARLAELPDLAGCLGAASIVLGGRGEDRRG